MSTTTTITIPTTEILAQHEHYEGHPAIEAIKAAAVERAVRYRIEEVVKYHHKLGFCWLVAGGPKNQTYRSEARIINDWNKSQSQQDLQQLANQTQLQESE